MAKAVSYPQGLTYDPRDKGWFLTEAALVAAWPMAVNGDWALVGETDTVWCWDGDTSAWVDTGSGGIPAPHAPSHEEGSSDEVELEKLLVDTLDTTRRLAPDGTGKAVWVSREWNVISVDTDYYVDPVAGDDSNDGLVGSPWKTINHASEEVSKLLIVNAQVRIICAAGTYTEVHPTRSDIHIVTPNPRLVGNGRVSVLGDPREHVGLGYSHNQYKSGSAFSGVMPYHGSDLISLSGDVAASSPSGHSEIVITASGTAPQVQADGWGAGDKIYVLLGSTVYCGTILSVTDNVPGKSTTIVLDETAWTDYSGGAVGEPALGGMNTIGSSITFVGDRILEATRRTGFEIRGAECFPRGWVIDGRGNANSYSYACFMAGLEEYYSTDEAGDPDYDGACMNILSLSHTSKRQYAMTIANTNQYNVVNITTIYGSVGTQRQIGGTFSAVTCWKLGTNGLTVLLCSSVLLVDCVFLASPTRYAISAINCTEIRTQYCLFDDVAYAVSANQVANLYVYRSQAYNCATRALNLSHVAMAYIVGHASYPSDWKDSPIFLYNHDGGNIIVENLPIELPTSGTAFDLANNVGMTLTGSTAITKAGGASGTTGIKASNFSRVIAVGITNTADTPIEADVDNQYGNNGSIIITVNVDTLRVIDPVNNLDAVNKQYGETNFRSRLSKLNKDMTAANASGDGVLACATPITATPYQDSDVMIDVCGIEMKLGDGVKTGCDCYFSADGGSTARAIADIANGDSLYWNSSVAGFDLVSSRHVISFHFSESV